MPIFIGDALLAMAKAGCYRCGRGDRIIDMDVIVEGEGALAVCAPCINDAAEAAGLTFNEARVRELTAERDDARLALLRAEASQDRIVNEAIVAVAAAREAEAAASLSGVALAEKVYGKGTPPAVRPATATTKKASR